MHASGRLACAGVDVRREAWGGQAAAAADAILTLHTFLPYIYRVCKRKRKNMYIWAITLHFFTFTKEKEKEKEKKKKEKNSNRRQNNVFSSYQIDISDSRYISRGIVYHIHYIYRTYIPSSPLHCKATYMYTHVTCIASNRYTTDAPYHPESPRASQV